jgi:hypothetical protein
MSCVCIEPPARAAVALPPFIFQADRFGRAVRSRIKKQKNTLPAFKSKVGKMTQLWISCASSPPVQAAHPAVPSVSGV